MPMEYVVMALRTMEGRLDAIETKAQQAWDIGTQAVEMHKGTRALLEPHIARDEQFLSTLVEMKSMLERRRAALMVGGWLVKGVRLLAIIVSSMALAFFWLHDSAGKFIAIVKDHFLK